MYQTRLTFQNWKRWETIIWVNLYSIVWFELFLKRGHSPWGQNKKGSKIYNLLLTCKVLGKIIQEWKVFTYFLRCYVPFTPSGCSKILCTVHHVCNLMQISHFTHIMNSLATCIRLTKLPFQNYRANEISPTTTALAHVISPLGTTWRGPEIKGWKQIPISAQTRARAIIDSLCSAVLNSFWAEIAAMTWYFVSLWIFHKNSFRMKIKESFKKA